MIEVRRGQDRGRAELGWLDSRHSFSFGTYFDPAQMGFGALRVINEDRVKAGAGFDQHGHQNMEIISYVIAGQLEHRDSLGNGSVISPGDVQRMTAGTGIMHSEYNPSEQEPVHFLQIWIIPETQDLEPGYQQLTFTQQDKLGRLLAVGSRDGHDGTVTIHQDVTLYASLLSDQHHITHKLDPRRQAWVQVVNGAVRVNGTPLAAGDGAKLTSEDALLLQGQLSQPSELLLFDLQKT